MTIQEARREIEKILREVEVEKVDAFKDKFMSVFFDIEAIVSNSKCYLGSVEGFSALRVEAEATYKAQKEIFDMLKELLEEEEKDNDTVSM